MENHHKHDTLKIMITPPDSPNELVSLIHHLISLAIGCPFYVAWIAVRGYLKKQGIYESLCNQLISEDGDCSPRDSAFAQLSVIALSSGFGFAFVGGILRDALGSKKTYVIANFMIIISMLIMYLEYKLSMTDNDVRLDLYPLAFLLWGASSEILCISVIGVQDIFPRNRSQIIALLSAVRSASMMLTTVLPRWNPSLDKTLLVYALICTFWTIYFVTSPYFSRDSFRAVASFSDFNQSLSAILSNCRSKEFISLVVYLMAFFSALNYITAMIATNFDSNVFMRNAVTFSIAFSGIIGAAAVGLLKSDQAVNLVPTFEVLSGSIILISILFGTFDLAKILILINLTIFMSLPAGQVYILVCNLFPSEFHGSLNGFAFLGGGFSGWLLSSYLVSRAEAIKDEFNSLLIMNLCIIIVTIAAYVNIILIITKKNYSTHTNLHFISFSKTSSLGSTNEPLLEYTTKV